MPGLPVLSGGQIIKYLCDRKGFRITRRSRHVILKSGDGKRMVPVPLHDELDRGTLAGILFRAGIDTDEFIEEWGKNKGR